MGHKTTRGPSAWGGGDTGGGGDAPADAGYVTTASSGALSNETLVGSIILPPDYEVNIPSAVGLVAGTIFIPIDRLIIYRADGAGNWTSSGSFTNVDINVDLSFQLVIGGVGGFTADTNEFDINTELRAPSMQSGGDITAGTITHNGTQGVVLYSPDSTAWRITVSNLGVLSVAAV